MFNFNETFSKIFKHRRNFKKESGLVSKFDKQKAEFVKEKFLRKSKSGDTFTYAPSNVLQYLTTFCTHFDS